MVLIYIAAVVLALVLFGALAIALSAPDSIAGSFFVSAGVFALVLPVAGVIWSFDLDYSNPRTQTCTVVGKQQASALIKEPTPSLKIHTQQCGTLEIEEMMLSDVENVWPIYYSIDQGKTYEFDLSGREHLGLSDYVNIVRVQGEHQ